MKTHVSALIALGLFVAACGDSSKVDNVESVDAIATASTVEAPPVTSAATAVVTTEVQVVTTVFVEGDEAAPEEPVADEPAPDEPVTSEPASEDIDQVPSDSIAEVWGVDVEDVECVIEQSASISADDLASGDVSPETIDTFAECDLDYEEMLAAGAFAEEFLNMYDLDDTEVDELIIEGIAEVLGTEPENVVCLIEMLDLSDPQQLVEELDSSDVLLAMVRCGIDVSNLANG